MYLKTQIYTEKYIYAIIKLHLLIAVILSKISKLIIYTYSIENIFKPPLRMMCMYIAQSSIFTFHSHTHSGYSSQPLADFLPTCLAQAVELWE